MAEIIYLKEDERILLEVEFLRKRLEHEGYRYFANIIPLIDEESIIVGGGFKTVKDFLRYLPKATLLDCEKEQYEALSVLIGADISECQEGTDFKYMEYELNKFLEVTNLDAERYAERQLAKTNIEAPQHPIFPEESGDVHISVPSGAVIISDYQAKKMLKERLNAYDEEMYLWFSRGYFPCLLSDTPNADGMVEVDTHSNVNNNFCYRFFFKADIEGFTPSKRFVSCKDVLDKWEIYQPREGNKNLLIGGCEKDLYAFEKPEALSLDASSAQLIREEQGWFYLDDIEEIERKQFGKCQEPDKLADSIGFPGRPTLMKAIIAEMKRRAENGQMQLKISHEAEHLEDWVDKKYPATQTPKKKSIENAIRTEYEKLKNKPKKALNPPLN